MKVRYRRNPILEEFDAVQWTGDNLDEIKEFVGPEYDIVVAENESFLDNMLTFYKKDEDVKEGVGYTCCELNGWVGMDETIGVIGFDDETIKENFHRISENNKKEFDMEDYQKRMVEEYLELGERLTKLEAKTKDVAFMESIDHRKANLMIMQKEIMQSYCRVLIMRMIEEDIDISTVLMDGENTKEE